ncbi:MAG: hypothetical protein P4L41_02780 [Flavipsychrobacter sp.]|nr:hypothetical protein [Flavipsychrobacter sp.]
MKTFFLLFFALFYSSLTSGQVLNVNCSVLDAIAKHKGIFELKENKQDKNILVDTFRFFTPECSGLHGAQEIEVLNQKPVLKEIKSNIFYVTYVSTDNNTLIVTIIQKLSNHLVSYHVSIRGKKITVVKTSSGDLD